MKKLFDYKEEIQKCSKCGLCQSVCPVYKVTGNDCAVSRGKFIMLNGIIKGDLNLNKNIAKYLDMCLKCNACKDFCPSGIDARKIFTTAKAEYFNNEANAKFIKILHSPLVFNLFMNLVKIVVNIYRFFKLDKLVRIFYPILQKCKLGLGQKVILANEFVGGTAIPPYRSPFTVHRSPRFTSHVSPLTVIYFKGCVNEYINPRTKNAVENILNQMGVNVINTDFHCCGVPFLSGGNVEQFIKQAKYNLVQIPDDFDYFLTDCASCQNAFKEYENYIEDEKLLEKLKKVNEKSVNIVDFVVRNAKSFEFNAEVHSKQNLQHQSRSGILARQQKTSNALNLPQKISFTFHKPCHLEDISFLQEFLKKAKNVEYREMKDYDVCCGFAGAFAINNPEISEKISVQKIQNAIDTKADYVLTSCPACLLGLNQGMIEGKGKREREKEEFLLRKNSNHSPIHLFTHSPSSHLSPLTSQFIEFLAASKIES